jgi:death-on-curing protein
LTSSSSTDPAHHSNNNFHDLTFDEIVRIRLEVEARFPSIYRGIQKPGLLEDIAKRPSQKHYNEEHFLDIYSKCASLMEAIIQWHPFYDGNKRMGLAVSYSYMYKNECILLTPLSAVRFSVLVARNEKKFDDIKEWIKTHTAHNSKEYLTKFEQYMIKPIDELLSLYERGRIDHDQTATQKANEIIDSWLAMDIYPEYRMEQKQTIAFLRDLANKTPIPFFNE